MAWFEYQRLDIDNTCAIEAPNKKMVMDLESHVVEGTVNEITQEEAEFIFSFNQKHGIHRSIVAGLLD